MKPLTTPQAILSGFALIALVITSLPYSSSGGWGGIRTHETLSRLPVFKTGAFNRSATHPANKINDLAGH